MALGGSAKKAEARWGKAAARLPALLRYNRGAPLHRACHFFVRILAAGSAVKVIGTDRSECGRERIARTRSAELRGGLINETCGRMAAKGRGDRVTKLPASRRRSPHERLDDSDHVALGVLNFFARSRLSAGISKCTTLFIASPRCDAGVANLKVDVRKP